MLVIRGNNVFPTAIEAILREFQEVAEYRLLVDQSETMADLRIEVEPYSDCDQAGLGERVEVAIRHRLHFRAEVTVVEAGTLPRPEMTAHRLVRGAQQRS